MFPFPQEVWAECADVGHIIFGLAVPQAEMCAPIQEAYPLNEAKKTGARVSTTITYRK